MPTYDYFCEANQRIVEVRHSMSEKLSTWGELAAAAKLDLGETPANSAVERLANGGQVVKASTLSNLTPPCQMGGERCAGCPGSA